MTVKDLIDKLTKLGLDKDVLVMDGHLVGPMTDKTFDMVFSQGKFGSKFGDFSKRHVVIKI